MGVEGSQALRHDLDAVAVAVDVVPEVASGRLDVIQVEGGGVTAVAGPEPLSMASGPDCALVVCSARKCRRSSAMSLAVVYRSEARFDRP